MPKPKLLAARLDEFVQTWLANPAAQRDFVRLVEDVHFHPTRDHADQPLLDWIEERSRALRSIGIK